VILDQSYIGALLAGIVSFLSPCVLPLVPAYLCFLAGADLAQAGKGPVEPAIARRAVWRATWFVAGFATVFVLLGATASAVGRLLSTWYDVLAVPAGLLLVLLGVNFLGVVRIGMFMREARYQTSGRPAGAFGAYLVGLAFAFGWTPCVGPVLAAILIVAGSQDSLWRGIGLLSFYALGIGLPFLLAALFVQPFLRVLSRFKRFISVVEKITGAGLIVTGLLIMTGRFSIVGNWLIEMFPALNSIG
jgi:cytochrome c-type biogenesis protein